MAGPLVQATELAGVDPEAMPTLLDVRWRLGAAPQALIAEFRDGHLPGAARVDLELDLADPPGRSGRHPLPARGRFGAAMRRVGVAAGRPVVVYDDARGTIAARAWWLLRHHGHDEVRVLDGGLAAWVEAGLPLETGEPPVAPGNFEPGPGRLDVVDAEGAAAIARRGVLLDARAPERYRGEVEPVDPAAGHIPGARSLPTAGNLASDGRLLAPELLVARFGAVGVRPGTAVAAYCGSGVTAAHEVLALDRAGISAALYPGSWSEWAADPERPIATGADPG